MRTEFTAMCLDAPGHGDHQNAKRSLDECASDIASQMVPGVLIGYSMGARMALHVALQHPSVVNTLVLISGTPGLHTESERAARRLSDEKLATHIEQVGIDVFIDEWLRQPIFSGLSNSTNQRNDRLRNSATGLADSLRFAGTGTQESLWDQLSQLQMAVHVIAGELDAKFTDIANKMHECITRSELTVVASVGHTVHLENPVLTARLLDSIILQSN